MALNLFSPSGPDGNTWSNHRLGGSPNPAPGAGTGAGIEPCRGAWRVQPCRRRGFTLPYGQEGQKVHGPGHTGGNRVCECGLTWGKRCDPNPALQGEGGLASARCMGWVVAGEEGEGRAAILIATALVQPNFLTHGKPWRPDVMALQATWAGG